jgi:haloalkane dehalogenase
VPDLDVLDSTIHYEEAGNGAPIVLLHGNPTSSFLWRNVIPTLASEGRCLAPDLIGMGRSGKPDIGYRFVDHARYLDAWFDALELDDITFVGHDWGGALAFHWASRHPDRVDGMAFFETIVKPVTWDEWYWPAGSRDAFEGFRTPGLGEELVLDRNVFVEGIPLGIQRTLSDDEMDAYRAPFVERDARRAVLQWPRELPIDGEPPDVVAIVHEYAEWLAQSEDVPKLLLTFEPGVEMTPAVVRWCRDTIAGLEVEHAGPGLHYVQEDHPEAIAAHVAAWRDRHGLGGS